MKPLKNENLKELTEKVLDLVARTGVEIGHKTDRETLANQVEDAFRLGVRFGKEEPFLNIRTFYRWVYAHKKVVDNAYYEVHTLGQKNVPFYQEPIKLLK